MSNISITNEDNMLLMARYPDNYFDLAIVDIPYGLGSKLTTGGTWSKKWQNKGHDWDVLPKKEFYKELFRVSKNWIIFGGNYAIEFLPNCRSFIAWHKPYMDGMHSMSNVELALTSFDKNAKKISFNKDKGNIERIHVTQKPVKLYEWLLMNYAKENDKILDTHLGSGSIAIACHNLKFDLTACELDKDYFDASIKRLHNHQSQLTMF
jgi:site-specific DNA-methyltransferase (adenine-specific)